MALLFPEYLALMELHGRTAVHNLGRLSPEAEVPPLPLSSRETAEDHLGTLDSWVWILENPSADLDEYPEWKTPEEYAHLIAGIATTLDRLARLLSRSGPDAPITYFDRPGTMAEVARLLAHEVVVAEHSTGLAADVSTLSLTPSIAADGIDHALRHWEMDFPELKAKVNIVRIMCTNTGDVWHLALKGDECFRVVGRADAAVVVKGMAEDVVWWLHGYMTPKGSVTLSGDRGTIHDLWGQLMLAGDEPPKGRRWFW